MTVEMFLQQLSGVRRNGKEWIARCPAHDDRTPSLSVAERDGKILFHCHAGCSQEAVLAATGIEKRELFLETSERRIVAEYDYRDERRELLSQVLRFEPKSFRQRRPDGNGGWTWNLDGTRRVLYRLPEVLAAKSVLIVEGEKDCETASKLGLAATTNAGGAEAKWRDEYSEALHGKRVAIIADADEPGRKHAQQVAAALAGKVASLRVLELPGAKDLTEWIEKGGTREQLLALIRSTAEWAPTELVAGEKDLKSTERKFDSPWAQAEGMDTFLNGEDEPIEFMLPHTIAKGNITEVFSPRGLGKSLWAIHAAVMLAKAGNKVLLIDRDNPRRTVRERLRAFGATHELTTLKFLSRESAPPLTNAAAWAGFPYADYDLVIIDSLDSAAEGVGEQDSAKPSRAIAPLLDIARRENGPAVLVLGNCVRRGTHSRGSGVIEDRADVVFELRDATNFHPSGKKPWIEELPPADAASWASRSARRKRQEKYRIAFVPTKFRIGEEPEPFTVEIDLTAEPWSVRDVTDDIDQEGKAERERRAREKAHAIDAATEALQAEIIRRQQVGEPEILKMAAEAFLMSGGFKRKIVREAVHSAAFQAVEISGKGHPKVLRLPGITDGAGGNTPLTKPAKIQWFSDADFRRPPSMHTAEIPPHETQYPCGSQKGGISAEDSVFTPPDMPGKPEFQEQELHTLECSELLSAQAQSPLLDPKVPASDTTPKTKADAKGTARPALESPNVEIEI